MVGLVETKSSPPPRWVPACRWPPRLRRSASRGPAASRCNLRQQLSERLSPRRSSRPATSLLALTIESALCWRSIKSGHSPTSLRISVLSMLHHPGPSRARYADSPASQTHTRYQVDPPQASPATGRTVSRHVGPLLGQTVRRSDGQTESEEIVEREWEKHSFTIQLVSLCHTYFIGLRGIFKDFFRSNESVVSLCFPFEKILEQNRKI